MFQMMFSSAWKKRWRRIVTCKRFLGQQEKHIFLVLAAMPRARVKRSLAADNEGTVVGDLCAVGGAF